MIPKVRDSWAAMHSPIVNMATTNLVNHEQDVWDDADLEPVLRWVEDHLQQRRVKTRRTTL